MVGCLTGSAWYLTRPRLLLGAKGIATRRTLLGAPGLITRSKKLLVRRASLLSKIVSRTALGAEMRRRAHGELPSYIPDFLQARNCWLDGRSCLFIHAPLSKTPSSAKRSLRCTAPARELQSRSEARELQAKQEEQGRYQGSWPYFISPNFKRIHCFLAERGPMSCPFRPLCHAALAWLV